MEEYEYEIKYIKGKENGAADALSRMHPLNVLAENSNSQSVDERNESYPTTDSNDERESLEESDEESQPIAERLRNCEDQERTKLYEEYQNCKTEPEMIKLKFVPVAIGKNWIKICKKNIFSLLRIQLPNYNEKEWT